MDRYDAACRANTAHSYDLHASGRKMLTRAFQYTAAQPGFVVLRLVLDLDHPDELPYAIRHDPVLFWAVCTSAPGEKYPPCVNFPVTVQLGLIDYETVTIMHPNGEIITADDLSFCSEAAWLEHEREKARQAINARGGVAR